MRTWHDARPVLCHPETQFKMKKGGDMSPERRQKLNRVRDKYLYTMHRKHYLWPKLAVKKGRL